MSTFEPAEREARITALQKQVAALRNQRRHGSEFREWKPDTFYYLFVLAFSLFLSWLTWRGGSARFELLSVTVGVLCCGLLCYAPAAVNRLRYWIYRRPNRRLDIQIESLQAEIRRLQGGQ